jgi:shikimate kinase
MTSALGHRNLVLIGMPGSGKSTVGVLLAKAANRRFVDTDVLLQAQQGRSLQEIIRAEGLDAFKRIEEEHLLALDLTGHVIATGGSAVYSERAMTHLKTGGLIVHLDLSLERVERRLTNLHQRGLVIESGQTLADLYRQRAPLYRRWADVAIACDGLTQEEVVDRILVAAERAE